MAISRARAAAFAIGAASIAVAAIAQDKQSPESLLPPGFNEPVTPAPAPSATGGAPVQPLPGADNAIEPSPTPTTSPTPVDPATLAKFEMPAFARRSLAQVGAIGTVEGGVAPDAFGKADGGYLEALMRWLSAPLPSRWLSIALRRTLTSRLDTPAGLDGADFAAERAWLLLRMGESVAARSVIESVDTGNATPKYRQVAMQAALATADPAGLCPLANTAALRSGERGWVLAQAMCASLGAAPGGAGPLIADARRRRVASGIDLQLAQKVIGAGVDSRQAITIEWEPVTQLTAWRFGLATATGVTVPDPLYATVGPQVTGWRALAAAIPIADRAAPAEAAAAMGVLSNAALVDLYAAIDAGDDTPPALGAIASDLRAAYVGADVATRIGALKQLWDEPQTRAGRYARLILTARAAARVRPGDGAAEADRMIAAMLSAGLDRQAQRWAGTASEGSDGWAMLALSDPDARTRLPYGAVSGYADGAKQRLFFAGLAGLGRLTTDDVERGAEALEVPIGARNAWTDALDRAVRERQPATVILLCAVGMQTADWRGVPPAALHRIVAALRAVGLGGEARMIAAEAIARL